MAMRNVLAGDNRAPIIAFLCVCVFILPIFGIFVATQRARPDDLWTVGLGVSGIALLLLTLIRPMVGIVVMLGLAAVIDYHFLLEARIYVSEVPINIMDLAAVLIIPVLLVPLQAKREPKEDAAQSLSTVLVVSLIVIFLFGAIRGAVEHNLQYDIARDLRPTLFLAVSFFSARKYVVTSQRRLIVFYVIAAGAVFSGLMLVASILPNVSLGSYLDVRSFGVGTASMDFVLILPVAFLLCGYYPFGRKIFMVLAALVAVLTTLLTFTMTNYFMVFLVPLIGTVLAPIRLRRKLIVSAGLVLIPLLLMSLSMLGAGLSGTGPVQSVARLVSQPAEEALGISDSVHYQGRMANWGQTLDRVPGTNLAIGNGIGVREFADSGVVGVGIAQVGEPTYPSYLIGVGLIGVLTLILLQSRFVLLFYRKMKSSVSLQMKAFILAGSIYGVAIIINGFLHNNFLTPQVSVLYGTLFGLVEAMERRDIPNTSS